MGFNITVEEHELDDSTLMLDVQTDDPGRLIGRQGQTLGQLQYILNRMLFKQDANVAKVTDVGGYRSQARDGLVQKAKEAAEKVRRWGDIVELEPMNAYDRRVVHNTLKEDPTVETYSVEVEGTQKKAILLRPRH
jgi:spoIIIJ-associated protein